MSIEIINTSNFQEKIKSDKPVIIDFFADWCGPCKMIAPILEEILEENSELIIYKLNVDNDGALASQFGVSSIPCLISFKNGEVYKKAVGFRDKDAILELVE